MFRFVTTSPRATHIHSTRFAAILFSFSMLAIDSGHPDEFCPQVTRLPSQSDQVDMTLSYFQMRALLTNKGARRVQVEADSRASETNILATSTFRAQKCSPYLHSKLHEGVAKKSKHKHNGE
eukprot:6207637-Pleurochrysis_carterae.AAC.1